MTFEPANGDVLGLARYTEIALQFLKDAYDDATRRRQGRPQENPLQRGLQVLSTLPLVRVDRYVSDEALERSIGFFVDR
eukprot:4200785-Prymnesium_polylepis.1